MSKQLLNLSAIINQGILTKKQWVFVPVSRKLNVILNFLQRLGFIGEFIIITSHNPKSKIRKRHYKISILYNIIGEPVLSCIYPISKPSRRIYVSVAQLQRIRKTTVVLLISTNAGILTHIEALQRRLGGELYCLVI